MGVGAVLGKNNKVKDNDQKAMSKTNRANCAATHCAIKVVFQITQCKVNPST